MDNDIFCIIFVLSNNNKGNMKSSELHRLILKNGWRSIRQAGSHVIYEKDGKTVSVPFHGSKEMGSGIARRFIREMGLK